MCATDLRVPYSAPLLTAQSLRVPPRTILSGRQLAQVLISIHVLTPLRSYGLMKMMLFTEVTGSKYDAGQHGYRV